jgi:hypothetical protein
MMDTPATAYKPISLPMKIVLWFVIVNAVLGAISLIFSPENTGSTFFWTITPPINAAMLGVLYASAAILLLQVVLQGRWESARFLVVTIPVFTGILLLTTLLHADRFIQDMRFYYWLLVYALLPIAAIYFYIQHERGGAVWQVVRKPLNPFVKQIAIFFGIMGLIFTLVGYFFPNLIIMIWAWTISPLMVRVFLSWVGALTVGLLWFSRENDWTRVQGSANLMIISSVLMLIIMLFHMAELNPNPVSVGAFVFGLLILMGFGLYLHWKHR